MARSGSGGFSVSISAVDEISKPLSNIGRELTALTKNLQTFQREATGTSTQRQASFFEQAKLFAVRGSRDMGHALRDLGAEARKTGEHFTRAFEPIAKLSGLGAGIGGALSIGGLAEGIERIARAGADLGHTSARIGVGTDSLQKLSAAAAVAGSSSTALSSGLEALGENLTSAALGQDSGFMAFAKQFNIALRNADGSIRSADSALGDLAEEFVKIKNPIVQGRFATIAFGGAGKELMPFLRDGRAGIAEFRKEAERYGYFLSSEGIEQTHRFERAQADLRIAFTGVGNAITENVLPTLTPLLKDTAEWLAANRQWIAQDIGGGIKSFGKELAAVNWREIGGDLKQIALAFTDIFDAIKKIEGSTHLFHDLMQWQGIGGIFGLGRGGLIQPGPNSPKLVPRGSQTVPGGGPGATAPIPGAFGGTRWNGSYGMSIPHLGGAGAAPAALGRQGWYNNPGNIRTSDAAWEGKGQPYTAGTSGGFETFTTPELGVRAAVKNIQAKFARGITTPAGLAAVLGPASDNNNPGWLAKQYGDALGIGINDPIPNTAEAFGKLIPAITNIEKPYDARSRYTPDVYSRGIASAFGGGGIAGGGGFSAARGIDLGAINPTLLSLSRAGAAGLPPGYSVEVTSGARAGGLGGSQHHGGNALDVQIIGPKGELIPNRGEDTTGLYGMYCIS